MEHDKSVDLSSLLTEDRKLKCRLACVSSVNLLSSGSELNDQFEMIDILTFLKIYYN